MSQRNTLFQNTDITVDQIMQRVHDQLTSKGFNLTESNIAQAVIEIFGSTSELNNYYIERAHEENFFETAKHYSSILSGSKQLGYVVQRPVPSKGRLYLKIKHKLSDIIDRSNFVDKAIYLTKFSSMTLDGNNMVLPETFEYTFTADDYDDGIDSDRDVYIISKDTTNGRYRTIYEKYAPRDDAGVIINSTSPLRIWKEGETYTDIRENEYLIFIDDQHTVYQGTIKERTFPNETNEQIGLKFQRYYINDATFSNFYGNDNDDKFHFTKIHIDEASAGNFTKTEATEYAVNRRTFFDIDYSNDEFDPDTSANVCVVETALDGGVIIKFGDALYAALGADSGEDIYIQYLSTTGNAGNIVGSANKKISTGDRIYINNLSTYKSYVEIFSDSNFTGGADIESADSIKNNAALSYSSLDRLVNRDDYKAYLRSLTSPIDIRYAKAWGEADEITDIRYKKKSIIEMFNVIMFTCIGSIYDVSDDSKNYSIKYDLSDVVLDSLDDIIIDDDNLRLEAQLQRLFTNTLTPLLQSYNSLSDIGISGTLASYFNNSDPSDKIVNVIDKLSKRASFSFRHVYASPLVKKIGMNGVVVVDDLYDIDQIKKEINNAIYKHLDKKVNFTTSIYKSKIVEIIEQFDGVRYTNFDFDYIGDSALVLSGDSFGKYYDAFTSAFCGAMSGISASKCRAYNAPAIDAYMDIVNKADPASASYDADAVYTTASTDRDFFEIVLPTILNDPAIYEYLLDGKEEIPEYHLINIYYMYMDYSANKFSENFLDEHGNISQANINGSGNYSIGNILPWILSNLEFKYSKS